MVSTSDDKATNPDRQQTDESLRVEREEADDAIGEKLAAIDETVDAIISQARARADEVLSAARAKSDRQSTTAVVSAIINRQRIGEDEALRKERVTADEGLRAERAEGAALFSNQRDETDKSLVSERTRSDEALSMRDEFLGLVSHDLRNLLSAIVLSASLIEKEVSQENHGEQIRKYALGILRSGGRMNRLLGDLIDVVSIEAGVLALTREIGDPTQVVTEAVNTLQSRAAASGVSLVAEIVPPLPPIAFDSARIFQVLINLLSNAIKFTQPNGKITLRVERIGEELRFAVHDTGLGIPADKLELIFERFFQIKKDDRRGMGLGLYISKRIVLGHGGRLWADSTLGKGSTFYFTLPICVSLRADQLRPDRSASAGALPG
jgi:signal transduction histidine kinase